MSTGPIEFERSPNVDELGSTEYGGDSGLVAGQPNVNAVGLSERRIDHLGHLTVVERLGILKRSKSGELTDVVVGKDGDVTVTVTTLADGIDPVTGLSVDMADADEGAPGVPAVLEQ